MVASSLPIWSAPLLFLSSFVAFDNLVRQAYGVTYLTELVVQIKNGPPTSGFELFRSHADDVIDAQNAHGNLTC